MKPTEGLENGLSFLDSARSRQLHAEGGSFQRRTVGLCGGKWLHFPEEETPGTFEDWGLAGLPAPSAFAFIQAPHLHEMNLFPHLSYPHLTTIPSLLCT